MTFVPIFVSTGMNAVGGQDYKWRSTVLVSVLCAAAWLRLICNSELWGEIAPGRRAGVKVR